jgi:hypothetical protein
MLYIAYKIKATPPGFWDSEAPIKQAKSLLKFGVARPLKRRGISCRFAFSSLTKCTSLVNVSNKAYIYATKPEEENGRSCVWRYDGKCIRRWDGLLASHQ